ncbi:MAG: hypothetical protein GY878_02155 [Fuerstiella sp.]|nr:hypothetical protein [Fuerstiella sp.]
MTNPYEPPTNNDDDATGSTSNPGRILLVFCGAFCLFRSFHQILKAMRLGLPPFWSDDFGITVQLAFGISAIWLGYRRYDRLGRWATIVWGILAAPATVIVAVIAGIAPGVLAVVVSVPILVIALRTRPNES